jgi:hypothetical protein
MYFHIMRFINNLIFFFLRNILNGNSQATEYKLNNIPVKLFSWEEPQKPQDEKPFKVVQKSKIFLSFF